MTFTAAHGEYTEVAARLVKWGYARHLQVCNDTRLSSGDARTIVRAVCGVRTKVRVKRIRRSWAYSDGSVTLSCNEERRVRLRSVLHECAHVLNDRKPRRLRGTPHGEAFCRTYARLLREVLE